MTRGHDGIGGPPRVAIATAVEPVVGRIERSSLVREPARVLSCIGEPVLGPGTIVDLVQLMIEAGLMGFCSVLGVTKHELLPTHTDMTPAQRVHGQNNLVVESLVAIEVVAKPSLNSENFIGYRFELVQSLIRCMRVDLSEWKSSKRVVQRKEGSIKSQASRTIFSGGDETKLSNPVLKISVVAVDNSSEL